MALTQEQYLSLYLDQSDLPQMRNVQDSRRGLLTHPNDTEWVRNNGLVVGLSIWQGADDAVIFQFKDIRFAFPDAARALAYHRAQLAVNSEGAQPVSGAAAVGSSCLVFGGVRRPPYAPDIPVTDYYYLFVVDCILVKLFAFQSLMLAPGTLTAQDFTPLARRVEMRVTTRLQSPAG